MKIIIPHDKKKTDKEYQKTLYICGIAFFVFAIGIVFSSFVFVIFGILLTVIFISSLFWGYRKQNLPKIILSTKGITDQTDWIHYGLIEWEDIITIRIAENKETIISIDVKNQAKYIDKLIVNKRFGSSYKQQLKQDAFGYGTAVFLDVKKLQGSREEIYTKIENYRVKLK
jgi:hypothetical protein